MRRGSKAKKMINSYDIYETAGEVTKGLGGMGVACPVGVAGVSAAEPFSLSE